MTKNNPNKKLLFITLSISLLIALVLNYPKKHNLRLVTFESDEERICWDGGCGWINNPRYEDIATYPNNPSAVPSIISDTPNSNIDNEVLIGKYREYSNETYSPLKAAVIGNKYIIYSLKENNTITTYKYDRDTQKTTKLFYQAKNGDIMYPLELQPETETHLLVVHYTKNDAFFEFINLEKETVSGKMKFSNLSWNRESYTATTTNPLNGTIKSFTCPYYTNILNCPNNTDQHDFENTFLKFNNPLQIDWFALDIPDNWSFDYQSNSLKTQYGIITWQTVTTDELPQINLNLYSRKPTRYYNNNKPYQVQLYQSPDQTKEIAHVISNKKAIIFNIVISNNEAKIIEHLIDNFETMLENIAIK